MKRNSVSPFPSNITLLNFVICEILSDEFYIDIWLVSYFYLINVATHMTPWGSLLSGQN